MGERAETQNVSGGKQKVEMTDKQRQRLQDIKESAFDSRDIAESNKWIVDMTNETLEEWNRGRAILEPLNSVVENEEAKEGIGREVEKKMFPYFQKIFGEFYFPTKGNISKMKAYGEEIPTRKYGKNDARIMLSQIILLRDTLTEMQKFHVNGSVVENF